LAAPPGKCSGEPSLAPSESSSRSFWASYPHPAVRQDGHGLGRIGKRRGSLLQHGTHVPESCILGCFDYPYIIVRWYRRSQTGLRTSFLSCESDGMCQRIVHASWPEAVQVSDIRRFGQDQPLAARALAPHAKVVCLISWPPCQDISGANSLAKGVEASRESETSSRPP
jgi:hypothetical protein